MENTGRLKNPALKWVMQITGKLINLALKWVIKYGAQMSICTFEFGAQMSCARGNTLVHFILSTIEAGSSHLDCSPFRLLIIIKRKHENAKAKGKTRIKIFLRFRVFAL